MLLFVSISFLSNEAHNPIRNLFKGTEVLCVLVQNPALIDFTLYDHMKEIRMNNFDVSSPFWPGVFYFNRGGKEVFVSIFCSDT